MHEAGVVDRCERPAHVLADRDRFTRVERTAGPQHVLERLARNELHAQADAVFVRLDAKHAHDVGVPNLRQRAPFAQQPFLQAAVGDVPVQDLDRDFPFQLRIQRAVDAPETALADLLAQTIPPPRFRAVVVGQRAIRRYCHRPRGRSCARRVARRDPSVERCRSAISPRIRRQLSRSRSSSGLCAPLSGAPVDRLAIGNGLGRSVDHIVNEHVASRPPGASSLG